MLINVVVRRRVASVAYSRLIAVLARRAAFAQTGQDGAAKPIRIRGLVGPYGD